MAATTCPSCGNVNPLGVEKCVKCGTTLPASARTVTCPSCGNVNPIGTAQCAKCGTVLPMDYLKPQIIKAEQEKKAIGAFKLTGLMLILTGFLIYIFPVAVWAWYGYKLPNVSCCPISGDALIPTVPTDVIYALLAVAMVAVAAAAVAWILFAVAFRALSSVDPTFNIASISAWIGIISAILVGAAIALDIVATANYLNCGNGSPSSDPTCLTNLNNQAYTVYWLWAFSIMFLIFGGIGVLVGLFRVGARYLTPTFWIAGFLMIFPILLFIGAILLVVGAGGAQKRLESWMEKSKPAAGGTAAAT